MRPPTLREAVLAAASATVISVLVVWLPGRDPLVGSVGGTSTSGMVRAPASFTISGDLSGAIAPGAVVPLDLSLENPNDFELAVQEITVVVRDVDAPRADARHGCSAEDFEVRQIQESMVPLSLGRQRTEDLSGLGLARDEWPAVGLRNRRVNQDGCQGAVLTLDYEATGAEVRR